MLPAQQVKPDLRAALRPDRRNQIPRGVDRRAVDRHDQIALLNPGLRRRRPPPLRRLHRTDACYQHTLRVDLDADDLPAHGELLRKGRRGCAEHGQAQKRRYCCFFHLFLPPACFCTRIQYVHAREK